MLWPCLLSEPSSLSSRLFSPWSMLLFFFSPSNHIDSPWPWPVTTVINRQQILHQRWRRTSELGQLQRGRNGAAQNVKCHAGTSGRKGWVTAERSRHYYSQHQIIKPAFSKPISYLISFIVLGSHLCAIYGALVVFWNVDPPLSFMVVFIFKNNGLFYYNCESIFYWHVISHGITVCKDY